MATTHYSYQGNPVDKLRIIGRLLEQFSPMICMHRLYAQAPSEYEAEVEIMNHFNGSNRFAQIKD